MDFPGPAFNLDLGPFLVLVPGRRPEDLVFTVYSTLTLAHIPMQQNTIHYSFLLERIYEGYIEMKQCIFSTEHVRSTSMSSQSCCVIV